MRENVELSVLRGELEVLEAETFEVVDYQSAEDMTAGASCCAATSSCNSTSTTSCCSSSG